MAAVNRPPIVWEGRTGNGEGGAELPQEQLDDRADISARGRIEGRAILEIKLSAADGFQPVKCIPGLVYCLLDGTGTRLERDDYGVDIFKLGIRLGDADCLNRPKAAFDQIVR